MGLKISPYQLYGKKGHNGLTMDTHMGSYYQKQPQRAAKNMVHLLQLHYGKNLESELNKYPTVQFPTTDDYYWDIIGSSRRNISLEVARYQGADVTSSTANVGMGGATIELVFPENYFFQNEIIVGELNERYRFLVISQVGEGTNTVYTVKLTGDTWASGITGAELVAGKKFSYEHTMIPEEMDRSVGGIRHAAPSRVAERFSRVRLDHKASGNRLGETMVIPMPFLNETGELKLAETWMQKEEFEFEKTFSEYKNHALKFGRSNKTAAGEYVDKDPLSGMTMRYGDGLRAQGERSNTYYYQDDDNVVKLITDILYQISYNKVPIADRKFVVSTGQQGAVKFHEGVLNNGSGWMATVNSAAYNPGTNPATVNTVSSNLHSNAMSAGFQFVEYRAPNGVVVTLDVQDSYDDPIRFKQLHSETNFPLESYRFDIAYIGKMENGNMANIQKVYGGPHTELRGFSWGPFRNPFTGAVNNMNASTDEDSATMHKKCPALGIIVKDPYRIVSLIHAQTVN